MESLRAKYNSNADKRNESNIVFAQKDAKPIYTDKSNEKLETIKEIVKKDMISSST
jgi:hypothetical protein